MSAWCGPLSHVIFFSSRRVKWGKELRDFWEKFLDKAFVVKIEEKNGFWKNKEKLRKKFLKEMSFFWKKTREFFKKMRKRFFRNVCSKQLGKKILCSARLGFTVPRGAHLGRATASRCFVAPWPFRHAPLCHGRCGTPIVLSATMPLHSTCSRYAAQSPQCRWQIMREEKELGG